jgi:hypothetical protein
MDKDKIVPFCMRCFSLSAVPVDNGHSFCHNCGGGGTCIEMKREDADYLMKNINSAIDNAKKKIKIT